MKLSLIFIQTLAVALLSCGIASAKDTPQSDKDKNSSWSKWKIATAATASVAALGTIGLGVVGHIANTKIQAQMQAHLPQWMLSKKQLSFIEKSKNGLKTGIFFAKMGWNLLKQKLRARHYLLPELGVIAGVVACTWAAKLYFDYYQKYKKKQLDNGIAK